LLMPPIMGSAVFIIMENLGVGYFTIIKTGSLTAILYYLGLFIMIDLEAQKKGLQGVPKAEIPPLKKTLKEGWHFLIPVAVLIYFIVFAKTSVTRAAFWANISIFIATSIRPGKRMTVKQILSGLEKGAYTALPVIAILALAGVVVGMVTLTGLGLMMSSILIELAHGNLMLLLFFTMLASILLGMGVPPVAAYIVLAILVVPALVDMGVYPLAAHLYVFYFSIVAGITPPMAPDAFIAAGISGAPMMKTALTACRLAITIFILPYIFVYNNALLFIGSWWEITWSALCALIAVYALSVCVQNYLEGTLPVIFRFLLAAACLGLVVPYYQLNVAGMFVVTAVILWQLKRVPLLQKSRRIRG
ncbi:MAG: TRAP transporter fused permease subunit, partial [Pseudomonadota bacterium]|nr:TRAP transporter fused permease subunit [Pseudomonadota bacterium]